MSRRRYRTRARSGEEPGNGGVSTTSTATTACSSTSSRSAATPAAPACSCPPPLSRAAHRGRPGTPRTRQPALEALPALALGSGLAKRGRRGAAEAGRGNWAWAGRSELQCQGHEDDEHDQNDDAPQRERPALPRHAPDLHLAGPDAQPGLMSAGGMPHQQPCGDRNENGQDRNRSAGLDRVGLAHRAVLRRVN